MKREISSGGIVYRKAGNDIYIMLIRDHNNKWSFPKGHVEKGEKPPDAAVREVEEETGIKADIVCPVGDIKYFFVKDGEKIFKIVSFFLMKTEQKDFVIQWEIKGASWVTVDEAVSIIASGKESYKNQLIVLNKAIEKIKEFSSKKSLRDF